MKRPKAGPAAIDTQPNRLPIFSCAAALAVCIAGCAPDDPATDAGEAEQADTAPVSETAETGVSESTGTAETTPETVEAVESEDVQAAQPATPAEAGRAFLAENAERDGVVTTASGLQYEVLASGDGASPGPTDTVTTHYHGTFVDGRVFDSSVQRGTPASFPVDRVIKGWTEALQMMRVGDKWKIVCPPDLAYGEQGRSGIPPSSTLIFEVELLEVKPSG